MQLGFSLFFPVGTIKSLDMPMERHHPHVSRGSCHVEFESHDQAEKAVKYMDGGQIDGQEITVAAVLPLGPTKAERDRKEMLGGGGRNNRDRGFRGGGGFRNDRRNRDR